MIKAKVMQIHLFSKWWIAERLSFKVLLPLSTFSARVDSGVCRLTMQTLNHLTDVLDGSTSEAFCTCTSFANPPYENHEMKNPLDERAESEPV